MKLLETYTPVCIDYNDSKGNPRIMFGVLCESSNMIYIGADHYFVSFDKKELVKGNNANGRKFGNNPTVTKLNSEES